MIFDSPSDAMMKRAREFLEFALLCPANEQEFQRQLSDAGISEKASFDDFMILAHAALMMADAGESASFRPWYRERASLLFCRAYDAVALEREARAASEAGAVQ